MGKKSKCSTQKRQAAFENHPLSEGSVQAECKITDDDYASGYADGLAGLPPMFTGGDRESYDDGYTDGFLSQCPR